MRPLGPALGELGLDRLEGLCRARPGGVHQIGRQAVLVVEQYLEQMFGRQTLVAFAQGQTLGRLDKALGAFGVVVDVHGSTVMAVSQPSR